MAPTVASLSTPGSKHAPSLVDNCWAVPVVIAIASFLFVLPQSNNGIFYVLFVNELGSSREGASWPKTIASACANFSGILVWALQRRLSILTIVTFAALICPLSIIVSAFVTNMAWMCVSWGFLYGSSSGILVVGTSVLIVSYFDEYRSLSTGITFVGRDLSGILGPSLLMCLLSAYAFKGTLLVLGGLLLHTIPLMLMLRHPRPLTFRACRGCCVHQQQENTTSQFECATIRQQVIHNAENTCFVQRREGWGKDTSRKLSHLAKATEYCNNTAPVPVGGEEQHDYPKDPSHQPAHETFHNVIAQAISLLKMPCFYVLLVAMAALEFNFPVLTSTIIDYSLDKGLPQNDATQVTSLISFGNLCGNMLIPAIADKVLRNRCRLAALACAISAVCFLAMPHLKSIASVSVVIFVAGLQTGYLRTLKAVLLADYLGVENVALSWGFMGIAALPLLLSEPSIVGTFRDIGGSYDNLYRTCAAIDVLAALLLVAQACLDARKSKRFKMSGATESK